MTVAVGVPRAAEAEVLRLGRRFMPAARLIAVAIAGAMALLAASGQDLVPAAIVVALVLSWSVLYLFARREVAPAWLPPADLAVLVAVGLSAQWTVPTAELFSGDGFVVAVLSVAVVAYQFDTRWPLGLPITVMLAGGYLAGGYLAAPDAWADGMHEGIWLVVKGLLARAFFELLRRFGK